MTFDFLRRTFDMIQEGDLKVFSQVSTHSKQVKKGDLFVALKGYRRDGHQFLKEAIQNGAKFLLVEDASSIPSSFKGTILKTKNTKEALPKILNEHYNFPFEKLFTVGITGTNGKTTVTHLVEHIFSRCGWKTGVIGTIDCHVDQKKWPSLLTTPESTELFKRTSEFLKHDAKSLVIELSSIGLDQGRVNGLELNIGIFTNLTWDHIDYHKNIESYFKSKSKLFLDSSCFKKENGFLGLINKDDVYGMRLLSQMKAPFKTYGTSPADFSFKIKKQDLLYTTFFLQTEFGSGDVKLSLAGIYNVYNAVVAIACGLSAGFSFKNVIKAVESFKGTTGRLERCTSSDHPFQVFVDYAHTPLALKAVLENLNQFKSHHLITVFGCGGDRDREKRAEMTRFAREYSDKVILTSDNPRDEDPKQIINDCLKNEKDPSYFIIENDRKKAIQKALEMSSEGDIILISGKGHESYQLIKGIKHPFKDQDIVREWIKS